jgi:uncharacterized membrane protein
MLFNLFRKSAFPGLEEDKIVRAIQTAEALTRAEIRVHIAKKSNGVDTLQLAIKTFETLGMTKTLEKNGVLIFIIPNEKKFAIIGDSGIHENVKESFWEQVKEEMRDHFSRGNLTDAIIHGIQRAGEKLALHFPANNKNNPNELSDEISLG